MLHKLNDVWVFWYVPRGRNKEYQEQQNYEKNLICLGECGTIEEFFNLYCFLKRPSDIPFDNKLMLFKKGWKPLWEENPTGGSWIQKINKNQMAELNLRWELLVFACIGNHFNNQNVTGVLVNRRDHVSNLELWASDQLEEGKKMLMGEQIRTLLCLEPTNLTFYFKQHTKALQELIIFINILLFLFIMYYILIYIK